MANYGNDSNPDSNNSYINKNLLIASLLLIEVQILFIQPYYLSFMALIADMYRSLGVF